MSEKEILGLSATGGIDHAGLPFVSVVMPVRNEAGFIHQSIGAVLAQDYPADRLEVIVADGLSDDGTREAVEALQAQQPNLSLIDNPGRIVSTGLNAALRIARGEIIVRVDGHCEIAVDYVSRCVSHLRKDKVDCVGGPLETIGENYTARVIAAAMSSTFGVGSPFRVLKDRTLLVDTVAFPAYTREALERAGPFDEELVRNQDDEYNYRLRKLKGTILLAADVQSRYHSRGTLRALCSQYFQYGYWKVRVMQKHPRQMRPRQFGPPLLVATLLTAAALTPFIPAAGYLLAVFGAVYLLGASGAAIGSARRSGWELLPLLPITFAILHLAYGAGFLIGLLKFWNRWGEGERNFHAHATIRDREV